jgi:hypothetical protein
MLNNNIEKSAYDWITAKPANVDVESEFYCETRDIFQARLDRLVIMLLRDEKLKSSISIVSAIAGEIGNNSFDHNLGNWPDVMGIFFGYEIKENKFIIAIADRGRGILKTLQRVKSKLKNDSEALQTAFTERISGRAPEKRGNGLKFVKENIKTKRMHLTFISGDAQADLNDKMEIKKIDKKINGCLAVISLWSRNFNIPDHCHA